MKLSQPKSARIINTSRILCALRTSPGLSKADLSRVLGLNKVSTGEIVDSLIMEGKIKETGKVQVLNGRKPTSLEIAYESSYVLAIIIGSRNITSALCDLAGRPLKMERIPSVNSTKAEVFCAEIIKICSRMMRNTEKNRIIGCGVIADAVVSEDRRTMVSSPFLPWQDIPICELIEKHIGVKTIISDATQALFLCEKIQDRSLVNCQGTLFLNWGDSVNLAVVSSGRIMTSSRGFGHIAVSSTGLCSCGKIGCLEAKIAPWALCSGGRHISDVWNNPGVEALKSLSYALMLANQVTGAFDVIISGEGSSLSDSSLDTLRKMCGDLKIRRSCLGDCAVIRSASETALDLWFYNSSLLDEVAEYL